MTLAFRLLRLLPYICSQTKKNLFHMSAMFILIGFSLLVAIGFLVAFLWAIRNGQYEDDYTPSVRMLFEDAETHRNSSDS